MPLDAGSFTKSDSAELTASHFVMVASPAVASVMEPDTSSITYISSGMRSASIRSPAQSSPTPELPPLLEPLPAKLPKLGPVLEPALPVPPPFTFEPELEPQADATSISTNEAPSTGQAAREKLMPNETTLWEPRTAGSTVVADWQSSRAFGRY